MEVHITLFNLIYFYRRVLIQLPVKSSNFTVTSLYILLLKLFLNISLLIPKKFSYKRKYV